MKMPKRLQERRDDFVDEHYASMAGWDYKKGFNACWDELAPVVEIVRVTAQGDSQWASEARRVLSDTIGE